MFAQLNKSLFDIDFKSKEFTSLEGLYNKVGTQVIQIEAVGTNKKTKFGEQPFCVTGSLIVNLPNHLMNDIKTIMSNDDMVQAVKNGKCGFTIYEYFDEKHNKKCYSVKWIDL